MRMLGLLSYLLTGPARPSGVHCSFRSFVSFHPHVLAAKYRSVRARTGIFTAFHSFPPRAARGLPK